MSGKLRDYTIGQEWEVNYLYNGQLSTSRCIKTVVNSSSILSATSRLTDQFYYSRKWGPLLDPVTTRSDKHACGKPMLTDHDKQATENREPANETNKEDPTQGMLVWLQPFTVNLEDLEAQVLAHSAERANSDSEGDASKEETQKRKHGVHAYFRKNQKRSTNGKAW